MVKFSWDREGAFTMVACDAVLFYAERTLALVHVVAFASLLRQWKGLFGSTGIVPWKVSHSLLLNYGSHGVPPTRRVGYHHSLVPCWPFLLPMPNPSASLAGPPQTHRHHRGSAREQAAWPGRMGSAAASEPNLRVVCVIGRCHRRGDGLGAAPCGSQRALRGMRHQAGSVLQHRGSSDVPAVQGARTSLPQHPAGPPPSRRQPRDKSMVSLVNSHTNATRIGWHLWEIDFRFASGLPPGWLPPPPACLAPHFLVSDEARTQREPPAVYHSD